LIVTNSLLFALSSNQSVKSPSLAKILTVETHQNALTKVFIVFHTYGVFQGVGILPIISVKS